MQQPTIFPAELASVNSIRQAHAGRAHPAPDYVLGLATRGAHVRVTGIRGDVAALEKRLAAMGIRIGSELEIIQHEGSTVVVRVGETRIAIGVALVHRLLVTPVAVAGRS
ncbi:MAG: FeoA family protein [Halothiobacillus sp.]|jgi:ferrous iron transport protein A|nr:FeoA family protein [Halothiobacillus sp.]